MKRSVIAASLGALCLVAPSAMASDVFGVNLRGGINLRQFPANDPSQMGNIVGPTVSTYAMDFNSAATALYAIRNTDTTNNVFDLGTIDTATGDFTLLTGVTGFQGLPTGMSVDPTDETFYVSTATTLFSLNTATGSLTPIGDFGTAVGTMIDIAVDANGNLYGHSITTDSLYSINKSTAEPTLIGATGINANFAQGMDFDFATNTLYASIYVGAGVGHYVSWNLDDGSVNILADTLSFNVEMEMAIASPIPAPATLALFGLGGALALRRRR